MYFRIRKGQFGLESAIIIIGIIIAIIAIVNATLAWSDVLESNFVKLITDMPVFEYDVSNGEETGNENFQLYMLLRNISFYIFLAAMFVAGISFMLEHVNWVPPETAINIISKSVFYIIFFFVFPALWDLSATMVEESSLWILNPEDPQNPIQKVEFIFSKLGAIETPEVSFDGIVAGIGDPVGVFEGFFLNVFLAAFKAIALIIFVFLVFIIGTIRMVFTAVLIIGLPVILTLSLIPWFFGITKKLLEALTGLLIAPIIASIVIVAGSAYLGTIETSTELEQGAIQQWFSALAVMALAVFIPVMLVPMLGSLVSTITTMTTGAVSSGAMLTGMAGMGGVRGGFGALRGFAGAQFGTAHPSWLEMAKAGFSRPGMSAFVRGSGTGSLEGLGAGSAVAAGTTLGAVPGGDHSIGHTLGRMGSHMMRDVGVQEVQMGVRMGENQIVTNEHRNFANEIATIENDLSIDRIGNMSNIEAGQRILNDSQARDSFLNERRNHIVNYERFSDEMKKDLETKELQLMRQHPAAIGKMINEMKSFTGSKQDSLNSENPT